MQIKNKLSMLIMIAMLSFSGLSYGMEPSFEEQLNLQKKELEEAREKLKEIQSELLSEKEQAKDIKKTLTIKDEELQSALKKINKAELNKVTEPVQKSFLYALYGLAGSAIAYHNPAATIPAFGLGLGLWGFTSLPTIKDAKKYVSTKTEIVYDYVEKKSCKSVADKGSFIVKLLLFTGTLYGLTKFVDFAGTKSQSVNYTNFRNFMFLLRNRGINKPISNAFRWLANLTRETGANPLNKFTSDKNR